MGNYKELRVWQEAIEFVKDVYSITNSEKMRKDFGLVNQMRRSGVSIASNIAEGDELNTNKQSVQYFYHARASTAELQTQLRIAFEVGYISESNFNALDDKCDKIRAMLNNLIKARKGQPSHSQPTTDNRKTIKRTTVKNTKGRFTN